MLSIRFILLHNLEFRSCSTFSSVLTLGKKSQLSGADSHETAESDQDDNSLTNFDATKGNKQHHFKQVGNDINTHPSDEDSPISLQYGACNSPKIRYARDDRKSRGSKRDKWNIGIDWREKGGFGEAGKGHLEQQHRPWKQGKSKWYEQVSARWNSSASRWDSSDGDRNSEANQWQRLPKHSSKSSNYNQTLNQKLQHPLSQVDQNQNFSQHKALADGSSSESSFYQPRDKPRGKRLRKKEKLGFIESEPEPAVPGAEQLLYGLHPVSLALTSGLRQVRRVYHRADAGPSNGRLSRVLAECAARGVTTVPLPAAQLDRIAGGTGVHQGVCARVTPLPPRSMDELLARAGCPPLTGGLLLTADVRGQKTAATEFWSVETDLTGSQGEGEMLDVKDTGRQLAVSANSETGRAAETEPPAIITPESEKQTDVSPAEGTAVTALRRRVWLMLDRVQDPMNFGSIIRSSYFLGVDAVIIPDKNRSVADSPTNKLKLMRHKNERYAILTFYSYCW